jgi:hypothetical protein
MQLTKAIIEIISGGIFIILNINNGIRNKNEKTTTFIIIFSEEEIFNPA